MSPALLCPFDPPKENMQMHEHTFLDDGDITRSQRDLLPSKKRQKTCAAPGAKPRTRQLAIKKHGSLAKLVDMPIDVLYEIFGHLHPLDLLHLSCTTKALRTLLLNRNSTCVWKNARNTLPYSDLFLDCPTDMSEPEYAYLLFDTHCHFCLTARVKHPFWAWRVRCCKNCLPVQFEDELQIRRSFPDVDELYLCHPKEKCGRRRLYLKSAFAEIYDLVEEIRAQGGAEAVQSFVMERSATIANINKRAAEEQLYAKSREEAHDRELADIRQQRQEGIQRELCALGWQEELDYMQEYDRSFQRHHLVCQSKPLTDRIWNNIKAPLIKFMEESKAQRLERERIDLITKRQKILISLLEAYCETRDEDEIVPKVGDVVLMAPFAAVLESDNTTIVTAESFADAILQLPYLCAKWRQEKDEFLLSIIPTAAHSTSSKLPKTVLELAITLFECKACYQPISYPQILSHKCLTDDSWAWRMGKEIRRYSSMSHFPWNFGGVWLTYHEEGARYAEQVLKACDMNPAVTTAEEMDSRNIRFVCECEYTELICAVPSGRNFMDWRKAIEHAIKRHPGLLASWSVMDDDKRIMDDFFPRSVLPIDRRVLEQTEFNFSKDWSCRRCVSFHGTLSDIKCHWIDAHGLVLDELTEEHYFRRPTFGLFGPSATTNRLQDFGETEIWDCVAGLTMADA